MTQLRESLTVRWQHLPEVTVGLPVISVALVSMMCGVQRMSIPGDASGWVGMAACALLAMNILSPLGFHLRRIGKTQLGRLCATTLRTIPLAMGLLALVLPRSM